MDWQSIISVARGAVFIFASAGILCVLPGAMRAMRGVLLARDGYKLAIAGILFSIMGFQSSYLFEGVVDGEAHWRVAFNLFGLLFSLVVLVGAFVVETAELEIRENKAPRALCIWRFVKRLGRGKQ